MSVIVGWASEGCVAMAADTSAYDDEGRRFSGVPKLVVVAPGVLLGLAGDFAALHRLQRRYEIEEPGENLDEWADDVALSLYMAAVADRAAWDGRPLVEDEDRPDYHGLLGTRGRMWEMSPDGDALPCLGPYETVGSGALTAVGACHVLSEAMGDQALTPEHLEEAVRQAAEAACSHTAYCYGPVVTLVVGQS